MSGFRLEHTHGVSQFVPRPVEFSEEMMSVHSQLIVLARRTLRRFPPFVGQQPVLFEAGEQRIERTFHHYQFGFLQPGDDVDGIACLPTEQEQDAVFQHALAHLRFGIVYIHIAGLFDGVSF